MQKSRNHIVAMTVAILCASSTSGLSGSLSGQKGDVHHKVMFMSGETGGCQSTYQRYLKASGHSAYASTPMYAWYDGYHCGARFGAKSQKEAERLALDQCNIAKKRYHVQTGPCEIMMSK